MSGKDDLTFEMANSGDDEGIILASQRSVLAAMQNVVNDIKRDCGGPGMTWTQIDYLIEEFKKKKPIIIKQESEF